MVKTESIYRIPKNLSTNLINISNHFMYVYILTRGETGAPIFQFTLLFSTARATVTDKFNTRITCRGIYISSSPTLLQSLAILYNTLFRKILQFCFPIHIMHAARPSHCQYIKLGNFCQSRVKYIFKCEIEKHQHT